jgi:hypothetical protein
MVLRGLKELIRKNDLRVEGFVLARFASYVAFFRFLQVVIVAVVFYL